MLPPTLFFFVALHLVALIRVLMLKGTGITLNTLWQVTVAALILGKAVLVADMLPFINRYPDKPLIYNIAWKTTIYVLVALLVHYLEHLVDFWRADRESGRGQPEVVRGDRVAAFLGHPTAPGRADSDVLHPARTDPCASDGTRSVPYCSTRRPRYAGPEGGPRHRGGGLGQGQHACASWPCVRCRPGARPA